MINVIRWASTRRGATIVVIEHDMALVRTLADHVFVLHNGSLVRVPAFPVQPVDTTGAGDSFNAGFLHAWLRKAPLGDALRFGAACGAISTLASGGTTAQATEAQVHDLLAKTVA